jgi:hypothetical protein
MIPLLHPTQTGKVVGRIEEPMMSQSTPCAAIPYLHLLVNRLFACLIHQWGMNPTWNYAGKESMIWARLTLLRRHRSDKVLLAFSFATRYLLQFQQLATWKIRKSTRNSTPLQLETPSTRLLKLSMSPATSRSLIETLASGASVLSAFLRIMPGRLVEGVLYVLLSMGRLGSHHLTSAFRSLLSMTAELQEFCMNLYDKPLA